MSLSWTLWSVSSLQAGPLACNPSTGAIIQSSGVSFFKSTDGAQTWSTLSTPPNPGGNQASVAFGGGTFVVFDNGTMYFSTNDGVSWSAAATNPSGIGANLATLMAFSPALGTGSGMWMLVQNNGFSTSIDGGNTWTALTGISVLSSGAHSTNNLFWDGTQFAVSGRDPTNSNSVITYTTDGSTWHSITIAAVGTDEIYTMSYAAGAYLVGMNGSEAVRQASTLSGLASASDISLSSILSGGTPTTAVFTPDGVQSVAAVLGNGSSNVTVAEQDSPTGSWVASTPASGLGVSQYCIYWCYDKFHGVIVGSINGTSANIITAPYALQVIVPNVVGQALATGEANIVAAGLTVGSVTTSYSGTVPAGDIISTSPAAGTIVSPGSAVNIVESLGATPTVTVSPHSQSVNFGAAFLFTATTTNPSGEACIWSVSGIIGGDSVHGTAVDGYYVAPALPNGIASVTVTAAMQTYPTSDSATVTLVVPTIGGGSTVGPGGVPGGTTYFTGKFRGPKVFKPSVLAKAATIPLRIYEPEENKTFKG